jgi:4a-hydroxytetrahydrobiopterin dehydratase
MPYAPLLTSEEIAAALQVLPDWRREGDVFIRELRCSSFRDAMAMVNRVADAAEAADHHPEIEINWRRVTYRLTTHAARGLTQRDVDMAHRIDELAC